MSKDPNKSDPKPAPPPIPLAPEGNKNDEVFDLSDLDDIAVPEAPRAEAEPLDAPSAALHAPTESFSFDVPIPGDDPGSLTMGISLEDLHDLANIGPETAGLSGHFPSTDPSSDYIPIPADPSSDYIPIPTDPSSTFDIMVTTPDPASSVSIIPEAAPGSSVAPSSENLDAIGNLEPVAPVAPASGWLDDAADAPIEPVDSRAALLAEPLEVHQADLLDAPPAIESSDIFSSGPIPTAAGADQSDVIAATAYGPLTPTPSGKPARPSEIALSFDQPPGGSTVHQEGGSGDLPVAEELPDSSGNLFDSAQLADTPILPDSKPTLEDDESDYGTTPITSPDASSILSDLSDPGEITFDESSSVRLEAPGVGRTLTNDPGEGTEFDLTISDDPVIPELDAAAAESVSGEATDWREQSGSDLFAEGRTAAEINLGSDSDRVNLADSDLTADDPSLTSSPSSIFSGEKIPDALGSKSGSGPGSDSVRIGRPLDEEDAAVEFSDHPTAADLESSIAALIGPPSPIQKHRQPGEKDEVDTPKKTTSPTATSADEAQDSGRVDWGAPGVADEEATIGFPHAMLDAPPSGILKRGMKATEPDEEPTRTEAAKDKSSPAKPAKGGPAKAASAVPDGSDPSVEIDWMAGSSSEEPIITPEVYEQETPSKDKEKGKNKDKKETNRDKKRLSPARELEGASGKKGGGGVAWIGGTLLGMIVASGACAGLYFGGVIPNATETTKTPQPGNQQGQHVPQTETQTPPTVADVKSALDSGDPARALKVLDDLRAAAPEKVSVETKAAIGQARLFAKVQGLGNTTVVAGDDPELKKAREELQAVVDDVEAVKTPAGEKAAVKAAIHLGLTYELAGDRAKAQGVYEKAIVEFPKFKTTFQAALDRLAATAPTTDGMSHRLPPADAEQLLFAVLLLQADPPAKEEEEAGVFFWKAVNLATAGKYGDAVDEIKKAKTAHVKQAKSMAGRGLNPLSDPLEQIFPRCCDDLKAYWELRAAIYANKNIADLIKKEGTEKALNELATAQKKAIEAVKLMADLKEATAKLTRSEMDLKDAQDKFAIKEKERLANEVKAREELVKAEDSILKAERSRKHVEDLVASLAKELQAAKLLPEKYDTNALLAAQKSAVLRATGPTLTGLLSPGMMAIGGAGLSTGQLIDIAERLAKSEAAAKNAAEKLVAETKRLTTENATEVKKLKEGHAADVKKLTDEYATEMKKLMDTYATSTAKLKEDQVAELKKMTDKFAVDLKKLTDDNAVAAKKLADGFEGKIKNLEAAVLKEKAAGEAMLARLRIDMGNAVSPAQTLDLWLSQLTELRRVPDADPALANTKKVLAASAPDSEDAAKAHTVAGLALLLKGNLSEAKELFQAARSSPAYKTAAGKEWVKAVDIGLASVTDPLAPYRLPVEKPRRDLKIAARSLDLGINAYKAGRYTDAVTALIDSTKADPTDPMAWYFLGAARWAIGAIDQAKEDYRQGGEWEKLSSLLARTISDNLEPIQGPARDALSVARP
ncbi:MAG TPA: tetratricopeptide repeat protein [Gemmata sp.]|nr:tetratricopeptide repeat protein [Gemmata sp.]